MDFSFSKWLATWLMKHLDPWLTRNDPPRRAYLCDFDRICYELRPGDVLLIEGRNRVSRLIQTVTLSPWSHAALYIGRLHDVEDASFRQFIKHHYPQAGNRQLLIESMLGKGTFVRELTHYRDDHMRICRPQGLSHQDAQGVINYAIQHIGMEYSLHHALDLARFLFPWSILPRRWRSSLFQHHALKPTEEICSSMIASAFASVRFPVLPLVRKNKEHALELIHRNPRLFTPSDFDYSPYFAIIKYPIFDLQAPSHYRDLPWQPGLVSHDEPLEPPEKPSQSQPLTVSTTEKN